MLIPSVKAITLQVMRSVKPKKHLGQHFLKDEFIAENIVNSLNEHRLYSEVLEVGPGMGMLTKYLLKKGFHLKVVEIDKESVEYLKKNLFFNPECILEADFLKMDIDPLFEGKSFGLIGNFPYNISSQIFFKVLEHKNKIPEVVGMLQKEVAERICANHGNKTYGILSVFLQAYYKVEYLFTVHEDVFIPPPKVKSAVIRLKRNDVKQLDCDEILFFKIVKAGFHTRRKTLRNALKSLNLPEEITKEEIFNKRAEQLSVKDFVLLTNLINQSS
jgi:16S rRNA (adenine1518-N6/adenine1519-N6)-dimethyltransferase